MELEREKARRKNEQWLERFEERSAKRREREEAKREREQEKAERKQERERRKLEVADNRQERDETWYERDLQRQEKEKQRDKERAERMQERDEDWYERDQRKQEAAKKQREQREWWDNPHNVARNQIDMGRRSAAIRGSSAAQRLGFSATSSVTRFSSALSVAAVRFAPLIAVATMMYAAWRKAQQNLLDEGKRVQKFSPALQAQNLINNMRNFKTDMEIANKYGDQMARVSDRQNRQENAWRKIEVGISSFLDDAFSPLSELYTRLLEWAAGSNKISADTNAYLEKLVGLSEKQLDELGIKNEQREAIALAMKNAEKIMNTLGGNGVFMEKDDMTKQFDNVVAGPAGGNADFIAPPAAWRAR